MIHEQAFDSEIVMCIVVDIDMFLARMRIVLNGSRLNFCN